MTILSWNIIRQCLWLGLFVLCGCIRPTPPVAPQPVQSPSELLARLDAVNNRYQTLQTSATIRIVTGDDQISASQFLLVQRPDRLRSEIFGPFTTPVLSLAADREQLSVFLPLQKKFQRGSATAANVARFTKLPLRIEDLVGIILVAPPRFSFEQSAVIATIGGDRLDLVAAGGVEQRFTFDAAGHLLQAVYLLSERIQLQVDYNAFDPARDDFPMTMQVTIPERQVVATMTFRESEINKEIPPERFVLKVPAGVKVQPLP